MRRKQAGMQTEAKTLQNNLERSLVKVLKQQGSQLLPLWKKAEKIQRQDLWKLSGGHLAYGQGLWPGDPYLGFWAHSR